MARGRELVLWSHNPYHHLRSLGHYQKSLDQLRRTKKNKKVTKSDFSKTTGYSTTNYIKSLLHNIGNIHTISVVDIAHTVKNLMEQLDKTIKMNYLPNDQVCNTFSYTNVSSTTIKIQYTISSTIETSRFIS